MITRETVKLKKKSIYTVIMLKLLQDDVTPNFIPTMIKKKKQKKKNLH